MKSSKLSDYGNVDIYSKSVKVNVEPNPCVKHVRGINTVAMNINQQGSKRSRKVSTQLLVINKKCARHNHVINQGVNIETSTSINKQGSVMDVHPTVQCLNRFAVLSVHNNVCSEPVNVQDREISTVTDSSRSKGESSHKPTHETEVPRLSTQSGDKYDLELRFKPKHRNAINAAKDNDTGLGLSKHWQIWLYSIR